jgi:MFS family permease
VTTPLHTGSRASLRDQADFWKLWSGQLLSLMGDSFLILALPLFAVTELHVTTARAALLPFALSVPFLVVSLPAGALIDRWRRRTVMLVCDAAQAGAFGAIVLLAHLHALAFPVLMSLLAVSGCAAVFFQVACTSFLPGLVRDPDRLHQGNARLYLSQSVARTLGPVTAGPVISVLGPVGAIAANACSFLSSLLAVGGISHRESRAPRRRDRARVRLTSEIGQGLRFVLRHPVLEPVLSAGTVYVFFLSMLDATLVLYLRFSRGMPTGEIGIVLGLAAIGAPLGSIASKHLSHRWGTSGAMVLSAAINVAGTATMPLSATLGWTPGLIAGGLAQGFGDAVFGPISLTLRQNAAGPDLAGRVNSIQRFLLWGTIPLGSAAASATITLTGLPTTLWIGGLGTILCLPTLMRRGVRRTLAAA